MKYFLLYIIVSTLITLISIMFAYKPEEEKEVVTANGKRGAKIRDIKGTQKESNPVYSARKTKPGQKQDNTGKRAFLI